MCVLRKISLFSLIKPFNFNAVIANDAQRAQRNDLAISAKTLRSLRLKNINYLGPIENNRLGKNQKNKLTAIKMNNHEQENNQEKQNMQDDKNKQDDK